ncbi:MAG: PTS sugar transporter subunit IIC [Defluviitaleaceae bacterium]|nr:PTS sugar transporter subunit IIC [Defluviitaleaceae bacterium]
MSTAKGKPVSLLKKAGRRYGLQAFNAMALGLFSSLIIGLIISQVAQLPFLSFLAPFSEIVSATSPVVGAATGVAIAYGIKVHQLAIFSSAATGAFGYMLGGPIGAYIAAVVGAEFGNLIAGKTKVDIVLVPGITIITGCLAGQFAGPGIDTAMTALGELINNATALQPIPMGAAIATLMGMTLTGPVSSAALAISMGLDGLAAGAATVGGAAQMVGFAVASYRENKFGGLLAQGLGTAMLQIPNILKRPQIWIPPTLAGAILGPISTSLLQMTNNPMGAGMGTSGFVGQIGTWASMSDTTDPVILFTKILFMHFILPAILTIIFSEIMRKKGWIRFGDMKLDL